MILALILEPVFQREKLDGSIVTCDWHGAQFDCKNGKLVKFPGEIEDLKSYKIVIESENIFVEI